jgi:lipoprotein-anchoring transpeptidase ErfK/SrfK
MGQRLLKFLKKQTSKALKEKTDLIIVAVFLIMVLICVISNAVSQKNDSEAPQDKLEVAGIYDSSLAAVSKGSAEADITKQADSDLPDVVAAGGIQAGSSEADESVQSPEEEENIILKEDNMEEGTSSNSKDVDPVPEEDPDIDFSNSDDFRIEVDLGKQKVFVYCKEKIIREMICSGGTDSSPTPIGEFVTSQKIEYDWVNRFDMGAYYWVRFYKTYLFHSIPFDKDGNMMMEEYEKLGSPVSHGCIRLELEEAKWLYEKLPLGVKVLIY